MIRRLHFA